MSEQKTIKAKTYNERTCNKCGWVHFGISIESAEEEVRRFNKMYEELTPGEKERYYGSRGASMEAYEKCCRCGNTYKDFHESEEGDCPRGCTIGPILED